MKALVTYDSVFGNTEKIALVIGNALGSGESVKTLRVSDVKPEDLRGLSLLIVGSPTRAFKPTKPIADFLNEIPASGLKGIKVAAFDTRLSVADVSSRFLNVMVRLFGYAAQPIAARLEKKGGVRVIPPEGFFVKDTEGPLKDGELKRAADWIKLAMKAQ